MFQIDHACLMGLHSRDSSGASGGVQLSIASAPLSASAPGALGHVASQRPALYRDASMDVSFSGAEQPHTHDDAIQTRNQIVQPPESSPTPWDLPPKPIDDSSLAVCLAAKKCCVKCMAFG